MDTTSKCRAEGWGWVGVDTEGQGRAQGKGTDHSPGSQPRPLSRHQPAPTAMRTVIVARQSHPVHPHAFLSTYPPPHTHTRASCSSPAPTSGPRVLAFPACHCRTLICPDGVRKGRLVTQHLNSWGHASMNLGFMVSGEQSQLAHVAQAHADVHVWLPSHAWCLLHE